MNRALPPGDRGHRVRDFSRQVAALRGRRLSVRLFCRLNTGRPGCERRHHPRQLGRIERCVVRDRSNRAGSVERHESVMSTLRDLEDLGARQRQPVPARASACL
jgi:hypothetical protein